MVLNNLSCDIEQTGQDVSSVIDLPLSQAGKLENLKALKSTRFAAVCLIGVMHKYLRNNV